MGQIIIEVTDKKGVKRPVTRITKECPQCGSHMLHHKKGDRKPHWKCTDKYCKHEERTESQKDKSIRRGFYDVSSGILKPIVIIK